MEQTKANQLEEITCFPEQNTFNFDNMIIEEGEVDESAIYDEDKQTERRE